MGERRWGHRDLKKPKSRCPALRVKRGREYLSKQRGPRGCTEKTGRRKEGPEARGKEKKASLRPLTTYPAAGLGTELRVERTTTKRRRRKCTAPTEKTQRPEARSGRKRRPIRLREVAGASENGLSAGGGQKKTPRFAGTTTGCP